MSDTPPFVVAPFRAGIETAITTLIVGIQNAFGIAITAADQPDLMDIETFYRTGAGEFWTATVGDEIVGTIALKPFGEHGGALRKMFVAAKWRGREHGVGAALLETLVTHARNCRLSHIILGSAEQLGRAHRFYEKSGFVAIDVEDLPAAFPRMAIDTKFYRLDLAAAAS